jgi:hypothetical protein
MQANGGTIADPFSGEKQINTIGVLQMQAIGGTIGEPF